MLYRNYRDLEAAGIAFARARLLDPRNTDWMYYHGEVLEQLGDTAGAMVAMNAVLAVQPRDLPAAVRLARLQTATGQVDAALERLDKLADRHADHAPTLATYAAALQRANRPAAAIAAWQKALALAGDFGSAHYALAQLYRDQGNSRQAAAHRARFEATRDIAAPVDDPRLQALFDLNASDQPLLRAAKAAKARGDQTGALQLLERAIERNPDNSNTRVSLINGYAATGQFDNAHEHYERGLRRAPDDLELRLAFGRLRLQEGATNEAVKLFERVLIESPEHVQARSWLGRALESLGREAAAGEAYARAVAIDPSDATARKFYAGWLIENSAYPGSIDTLNDLIDPALPDAALLHAAVAAAHDRNGRRDAAREALMQGIESAQLQGQARMATRLRDQLQKLGGGSP